MNKLSSLYRKELLEHLQSHHFDLLVIGGGITGAGIALDASSRGLKVALVEKGDFASGTSSKSTKLIHGGLRYLKQFEIDLVREVGRERAILHQNAPHIVKPEHMLLPIIDEGSLGRLTSFVGLSVYDWLAGVKLSERKSMLTKFATRKKEPLLREDILKGGAIYMEYRTDDARLVIEVIKTAAQYDSWCANYSEALELIYDSGKVVGAKVKDRIGNLDFSIRAKKIVNAAGPWVDKIREKDHSLKGKRLHLTKGVHIVVPYERLPVKQSAYVDVKDGRMIFIIPRGEITYIGTTDTNYTEGIDDPKPTIEDANYLLEAVNFMFPTVKLEPKDIISSWAGLRPLIHEEGKSPSELSRKDEIFFSSSGLLSIAGGKLTGFRKMAEKVVDIVMLQLNNEEGRKVKKCYTDEIVLSGGDFKDEYAIPEYVDELAENYKSVDFPEKKIEAMVNRYGSNTDKILSKAAEMSEKISPEEKMLAAELNYGIDLEVVTNLCDFFVRRTGKLFFERWAVEKEYVFLKPRIEEILQWSDEKKKSYHAFFMTEYKSVVDFK